MVAKSVDYHGNDSLGKGMNVTMATAGSERVGPLTVDAREAARMLGISERHLWTLTKLGRIHSVAGLGRSVRYSVDYLREWIIRQSKGE